MVSSMLQPSLVRCVMTACLLAACGDPSQPAAPTPDAAADGQPQDDAKPLQDAAVDHADAESDPEGGADTGDEGDGDAEALPDAADTSIDAALPDAADTNVDGAPPGDAAAMQDAATLDADDAVGPGPTLPTSHPLATTEDVARMFHLHQLGSSAVRQIVLRQHDVGDEACPGPQTWSGSTVSGALVGPCQLDAGTYSATLSGAWDASWTDVCKDATQPRGFLLDASAVTLVGAVGDEPVDLAFDLEMRVDQDTGESGYAWTGTASLKAVPSSWMPSIASLVTGAELTAVEITREGDDLGGTWLTGWQEVAGEGSVLFTTPVPLVWLDTPSCFVPTAGQVRMQGAADVVVTFDAGAGCDDPTWTRDGVEMGPVDLKFWGWFTLCGGVGP